MNRTTSSITIALLIGLVLGLLMPGSKQVIGQGNGNSNAPSFSQHYKSLEFDVTPSDEFVHFDLPVSDKPIQMLASATGVVINGQPQAPIVYSAIVQRDSATGKTYGIVPNGLIGPVQMGNDFLTFGLNVDDNSTSLPTPFFTVVSTYGGVVSYPSAHVQISMWY
jgi:hypothetical protein